MKQYDIDKLKEARQLVKEVFDYYYGANGDYSLSNRLATILRKLDDAMIIGYEQENNK